MHSGPSWFRSVRSRAVATLAVVAFALPMAHVPAIADSAAAPSASPTPAQNGSLQIDEKLADNQKLIDESGPDAVAALKLGNDADDAAKAAQALNTETLGPVNAGLDATKTAVDAIANAPVELISIDNAPRQQLWTIIERDNAAANADLAKLAATAPGANASDCDKLHDALEQLDLSGDAIAAAAAAPADVLHYIKGLFARAQGAGAAEALEDQLRNELDPELFAMSGSVSGADAASKLILDDAYVIEDQERKANCGEMAGTFDEVMNATFFTKSNTKWWTYETDIRGTIHLRYTYADAKQTPEAVTGDITGAATKFTVWTDPFNSPPGEKFIGGSLVDKVETPPDAEPALALQSTGALMGEPATFELPLTGTITGNSLQLTLGDSTKDFDPDAIQSNTVFTIASPYTMYRPIKTSYKLPYKDVHFMLEHFFPATWMLAQQGSTTVLDVSAMKDKPGAQNDATYDLDIKVCDPGCV